MPVQIELRARLFHWLISPSPKPEHGHYIEYTFELATVFANVLFLLGSACFLGGAHVVGACLFFCGSLVLTVLSALNVLEQRAYRSHRAASDAKLLLLQPDDERRRAEQAAAGRLLENACYCASGAVFTLGSLLYVHRFYHRVEDERIGSWLFVAGSVGYTFATFFNALGLPYMHVACPHFPFGVARAAYRCAATALCCAQLGSVCFVTGSYLFRPALATQCAERDGADTLPCTSSLRQGELLYVLGSLLFVVQSCLNVCACAVKDRASAMAKQGAAGAESERGDGAGSAASSEVTVF